MEEKKLTDEEMIKAYELCVMDGVGCAECPYSVYAREGLGYCNGDIEEDILDLLQRQKAEIERLTEENGYLKQCADTFLEDCKRERKQAVKDTAKEILQTIKRAKENGQMYYGEDFMITAQKAYGVEVE